MTTKCPKCETTFRVSEAQLQVAKGKVRCGSCLHVFKAEDHWVNPPAAKPVVAANKASSSEKPAGKFVFDQSAIDGGSADKVLTKPVPAVNTLGEMRAVAAKPQAVLKDEDEGFLIHDDEPSESGEAAGIRPVGDDEDYSDLFLNMDDDSVTDFDAVIDDESEGLNKKSHSKKASESADESWAKNMLDEEGDDTKEREAQLKSIMNAGTKDNVFVDDGHVKKQDGPRSGFISGNQIDSEKERDIGKPPPRPPLNRKELLSKIEPAPVEMTWAGGASDWLGFALWTSLNVVAILCLALQYAWINFDTLAREPSYRPLYSAACAVAGCDLPDMFNPAAIRSSNLVVRSDPQMPGVLIVDAIVQNTASYEQPFPDLELYFSDLNNFPVASRHFHPGEYLSGEMAGKNQMPSAKSIHISLQIVDPGDKAVNYRLQISDKKPVNS